MVLLALAALSVAGAAVTRRAARAADYSATLAQDYQRAEVAVAAEESLERMYRIVPNPVTVRVEIFNVDACRFAVWFAARATAVPTSASAATEPTTKSVFMRISY